LLIFEKLTIKFFLIATGSNCY